LQDVIEASKSMCVCGSDTVLSVCQWPRSDVEVKSADYTDGVVPDVGATSVQGTVGSALCLLFVFSNDSIPGSLQSVSK
jgi:hypothetical protein